MRVGILELDPLTADPGSPTEGMVWFNSTTKQHKRYLDGVIEVIADITDIIGNLDGGKADTNFGGIDAIDGGSA